MITDQKTIQAAAHFARKDLIDFCIFTDKRYEPNWHHELIAEKLEKVAKGEIKRLMIFMPPRHGKSQLATINFPAWYLGQNKDKEIITASYSSDLAQEFGEKTRNLVNSQEYKFLFDTRLKEDSQAKDKWRTQEGGSYLSVGVGGSLTGRGANIILIDDPFKNREEAESEVIRNKVWNWYTSTAYTRLEKDGAIIVIMTRWHLDDLAGRLLKQEHEGWEVLNLPAIAIQDEENRKIGEPLWPWKYNLEALEKIKTTIGVRDWLALYQQNPVAVENQEFKEIYFRYFEEEEIKNKLFHYTITVDLAISKNEGSDRTAIVVVGKEPDNPNWYIVDIKVGRFDPLETIDMIFQLYENYRLKGPVTVGVESVAYQKALLYFLDEEQRRRQVYFSVVELKAKGHKEERIRGLIPLYRTRVIQHRKTYKELEEELLSFPAAVHDDIADALAYQLSIQENTRKPQGESRADKIMKRRIERSRFSATI